MHPAPAHPGRPRVRLLVKAELQPVLGCDARARAPVEGDDEEDDDDDEEVQPPAPHARFEDVEKYLLEREVPALDAPRRGRHVRAQALPGAEDPHPLLLHPLASPPGSEAGGFAVEVNPRVHVQLLFQRGKDVPELQHRDLARDCRLEVALVLTNVARLDVRKRVSPLRCTLVLQTLPKLGHASGFPDPCVDMSPALHPLHLKCGASPPPRRVCVVLPFPARRVQRRRHPVPQPPAALDTLGQVPGPAGPAVLALDLVHQGSWAGGALRERLQLALASSSSAGLVLGSQEVRGQGFLAPAPVGVVRPGLLFRHPVRAEAFRLRLSPPFASLPPPPASLPLRREFHPKSQPALLLPRLLPLALLLLGPLSHLLVVLQPVESPELSLPGKLDEAFAPGPSRQVSPAPRRVPRCVPSPQAVPDTEEGGDAVFSAPLALGQCPELCVVIVTHDAAQPPPWSGIGVRGNGIRHSIEELTENLR